MKQNELIIKIKQVENEVNRRKSNNKLCFYNVGKKVHKKQLAFHKCKKRNRWVFGGNRSGKTECGAVECIYFARGIHPYRKNKDNVFGWVVSLSQQVQRDVAQRKILDYLNPDWIEDIIMLSGKKDDPKTGVIDQIKIKNVFGGISVIGFKSCEAGREKFQGASLDFVWFDEEPPKDIYDECRMRVLDRRGDVFGTMTPLKGLTFIYEEIYLNKYNSDEVWYEFIEWADNPFLNKNEIKSLQKSMSKDMLESRRFGRFCVNEGLVYTEFDENKCIVEPFEVPSEWFDTISIDPGLNNPTSVHWYAVDYDGNVYVIFEHFESGKNVDYHANAIKQICEKLHWKKDGCGKITALIDSASNQKTLASAKSVAELFYEKGICVNTNVNKDLFSGIARVKNYLDFNNGLPNLYIFKNCVNLIREIKGYFWGSGDNPIKKDDHSLDEMRYYLMSKPKIKEEREVKSEVQKDKEKLFRKIVNSRRRNF